MLGSALYNTVALAAIVLLMSEYLSTHHDRSHPLLGITYLGHRRWLYYQIVSTSSFASGPWIAPPMVYESHRAGEAFSWPAFCLLGLRARRVVPSRNQRQRHRHGSGAPPLQFSSRCFLDYLLNQYNPALATNVRKAADGIGWIFQFGMGYTFYLPFALYMAGLLCWSYTVIKLLLTMGRLAGHGLGPVYRGLASCTRI